MKSVSYALLIAILFIGLSGCGDDSTSTDIEEAPQTPNLEQAQPDVSFFEENNLQKEIATEGATTNNYNQAKSTVLFNSILFSFGQSYNMLFTEASQEEATFDNGVWEWAYSYNYQGVSADFRTTAEEVANSMRWATFWSYDDGQDISFENYKVFEGTISNDESSGDWTFYAPDPELEEETPFMTSTWDITSETEKEIILEIFGEAIDEENTGKVATVYFEQNGAEFSMTFEFTDDENYLVTWNTDTNIGSITFGGETLCWDENFQDAECE